VVDRSPAIEPLGARALPGGGFALGVWAPAAERVAVVLDPGGEAERTLALARREPADRGGWCGAVAEASHGDRYLLEVDGTRVADPWSRWQPEGTDGPSAFVDPAAIGAGAPGDGGRPARPDPLPAHRVIAELHVGAASAAGTFDGLVPRLDHLAALGVTHVELMPVAQFPGDHGWGYDGIFWSAAQHSYGGPAGLVRFVDEAHARGLGVILDVVFNHVGPTGAETYRAFGPFFTDRHTTPWGDAVNVDGPGSDGVRATILAAARWWVGEIGVDGLRVDACHAIVDQSARHVLAELTAEVRALHPGAWLIAESGLNDPRVVRREAAGGWGFDADWADDFHHALRTLLTNDREAWLRDFGRVAQLAKAFDRPLVHDGCWSAYRQRTFGAPAGDVDPGAFVVFSQNHDQVGNRPLGDRPPPDARPLAACCTLFSPATPLLFLGEEIGEHAPFPFFSDHRDPFIADATREGRRREFADFAAAHGTEVPDPQDPATFDAAKPAWRPDPAVAELYRALLARRRLLPRREVRTTFDEEARWLVVERGPWTLVANFADDEATVPCRPGRVEVATHPGVAFDEGGGGLRVPAKGGAWVVAEGPDPDGTAA
jgi:maltooligosyltrehalose trehalohydrolase